MRAKRGGRQKRRRWTVEERRGILRELNESGMTVRDFGDAIGVNGSLPREWRRRYAEERKAGRGRVRDRRGRNEVVARRRDRLSSAFVRAVIVDGEGDCEAGSGPGDGGSS